MRFVCRMNDELQSAFVLCDDLCSCFIIYLEIILHSRDTSREIMSDDESLALSKQKSEVI